MSQYHILLFYHYKNLDKENLEQLKQRHQEFCENLDIKGRIIIAEEGINGTISVTIDDSEKYKKFVLSELELDNLDFKDEESDCHVFQKLSIKVKKEIIRMGVESKPSEVTGKHIKPKEWSELIKNPNNLVIDMRSNYEHKLGKFANAVTFDIDSMYDFPKVFENHELFQKPGIKDKKILTYCTGGIKCEKASEFFIKNGFTDVNQLEGGIIRYSKDMGGEDFEGKCYVFDERIGIDVNKVNPKIISECYVCQTPTDVMVNCINEKCNRHTTICKTCYTKFDSCCSEECMKSEKKRGKLVDYFI